MTLIILAAGMGSRYGGLKQLSPVGPREEILLDYSVADAVSAGFTEVVFVIRRQIETAFDEMIGTRYKAVFPELAVHYVFQDPTDLPEYFSLPEGRTKPWGTGHALLAARNQVKRPFAVINADDYYGPEGYRLLKKFLEEPKKTGSYAMVAYSLKNTLSEHGSVSRGICEVDTNHFLSNITERTSIHATSSGIVAKEKNGTLIPLTGNEWVSLNFWGFTPDIFPHLEKEFSQFLEQQENHATAEFYLPSAVSTFIQEKKATVQLLPTSAPWFGLTHPDDLTHVRQALTNLG